MPSALKAVLDDLNGRISIFADQKDCGASCIFVSVNDLRLVLNEFIDPETEPTTKEATR